MLPVVLLSLMIGFFVLCVIAIVIFARGAFWGEKDMAEEAKAILTWRPPFLRGGALRNWAATTTEQLAQNRLRGKRTRKTAVQLAAELEEGAMHAMLPLARQAELERIVACPETGQGIVGVTAVEALTIAAHLCKSRSRAEQKRIVACPETGQGIVGVTAVEALAIAAHLCKSRSRAEQERIHALALENSKTIALRAHGDSNLPPLPCPLQGQDDVCCVYAARPLRCRPLHAIAVAKGMGSRSGEVAESQAEAPDEDRHEQTIEQGIEIGLTRALKSAGVDANVYELNSALAMALETPDAAERWANGENVFATCHCLEGMARPCQNSNRGFVDAGVFTPRANGASFQKRRHG